MESPSTPDEKGRRRNGRLMSFRSPTIETDLLNTPHTVRRHVCVPVWWHLPHVERISKTERCDVPILVKPQEPMQWMWTVLQGRNWGNLLQTTALNPIAPPTKKKSTIPCTTSSSDSWRTRSILTMTRTGRSTTVSHLTHECDRVKGGARHHERCLRGCWACPSRCLSAPRHERHRG